MLVGFVFQSHLVQAEPVRLAHSKNALEKTRSTVKLAKTLSKESSSIYKFSNNNNASKSKKSKF
mgnify:CR=1 FL=1